MSTARIEKLIRAGRRAIRRAKQCPHGKCSHRGEQHVRKGAACAVRDCTCPDVGAIVYEMDMTVEITYLRPDEIHDEGFYHMLSDILRRAQKQYKKYKFELLSVSGIKEVKTLRKREVK